MTKLIRIVMLARKNSRELFVSGRLFEPPLNGLSYTSAVAVWIWAGTRRFSHWRAVSHTIGSRMPGRRKSRLGRAPVITAAHLARKPAPRRCDTAAQASRKIGNLPHI